MTTLSVPVPGQRESQYEIRVEAGGLAGLAEVCRPVPAHRYAIVADSHVAELYGPAALAAMTAGELEAELFTFPAGEWNKSAEQWAELSGRLVWAGFGRDCALVALGGGVTGDLAGFVASTYMRGVPVIHVPTTLLAMVDSSVGGKTGIDTGPVKNAVGTFHHPAAVLIDPRLLATLPRYQRVSGLAEAVKAAAIRDADFLAWIEDRASLLEAGDLESTTGLVERSVAIKAAVVGEDPDERGLRTILNFGHTFGHALESLSGFSILHGEAVAAGMRVEARLGEVLGVTQDGTARRLDGVLGACGLPDVLEPPLHPDELLERARPDKKVRGGALRWVLLARPGEVARTDAGEYAHALSAEHSRVPLETALRLTVEAADSTP